MRVACGFLIEKIGVGARNGLFRYPHNIIMASGTYG